MTKEDIRKRIQSAVSTMPHGERVRRLSLFGSQLRGSAGPDSDIDLLVEFSTPVGYFELARIGRHLTEFLGARVDLVTPAALSKYFRDEVVRQAEPLYER